MVEKIAFDKFEEINKLDSVVDKHRAWLKDYLGFVYSIAYDKKHQIKWKEEKRRYQEFDSKINCIARLPNRTIIEFDGENAQENFDRVHLKVNEMGWGFIRSSHKGKSDYLWIEFTREMKDQEVKKFLQWICPEGAEIDLNFASSNRVFPVLFAIHWKHSQNRELPVEFSRGTKIDYDSLNIPEEKSKTTFVNQGGFMYHTFRKAASIFTKNGAAEEFEKIQPLFYDKSGIWWLWDNIIKTWRIVDEVDILNMIRETTGEDTISSKNRTEILNSLKQQGRKNVPKPIEKTWIQFMDEVVDFKTGRRFHATPEYFVTNPIPWKLNEDKFEETPVMDKIFEEWVGKDYVKTLYEIIAYCLLPDYPLHRLFCFIGAGMNGKSCFLRLLKKFIGEENVTATELDTLLASRFEVTRLHKKLVCIMGETDFNELSRTSILKKLTGQDMVGFEYKNKNPFEDCNYAKILIATNNLPVTTDKTIGFYRRWCIIDFPNQFSEEKDILDEIPEEEYESLALKSISMLKDTLHARKFTNEGTIEERTKKYEARSNFLEKFIKEYTDQGNFEDYITVSDFNKKFCAWCKENRHREMSETSIGTDLKKLGLEQARKYFSWMFSDKGGYARIWTGIRWK